MITTRACCLTVALVVLLYLPDTARSLSSNIEPAPVTIAYFKDDRSKESGGSSETNKNKMFAMQLDSKNRGKLAQIETSTLSNLL